MQEYPYEARDWAAAPNNVNGGDPGSRLARTRSRVDDGCEGSQPQQCASFAEARHLTSIGRFEAHLFLIVRGSLCRVRQPRVPLMANVRHHQEGLGTSRRTSSMTAIMPKRAMPIVYR